MYEEKKPKEETTEEYASLEFKEDHITCQDGQHEWVFSGEDRLSRMRSETCVKCWMGRSFGMDD